MARFSRRNPLALMVLGVLWERPCHPYQIVQVLKGRRKDTSARLNYGSLYTVVAALEKAGLIEAVEVTREGNLPPRTTYRVTDAGIAEMRDWLASLLADPQPEYPVYLTALSLLPGLPLEEAVELLERRAGALRRDLARMTQEKEQWQALIPDLMRVESAYQEAMAQAELAFTEKLVADIRGGAMTGLAGWRALYRTLRDGRPDPAQMTAGFAEEGFRLDDYD